jgi:endonuclease YncB( thermonuclease family)
MDAARLSFSVLTALALLVATNAPARACGAEAFGTGRVAAIEDRQTFRLGDGRRFRLAGVEWAVPPDRARAALAQGLLDRTVALSGFDKAADRHGRLHAFPIVSGSETPIQYALLEQGLALVNGQIADGTCRETLLRLERTARAAGRGGWAENGSAHLHDAGKPAGILKDRGRFGIGRPEIPFMSISAGAGRRTSRRRLRKGITPPLYRRASCPGRWPGAPSEFGGSSRNVQGPGSRPRRRGSSRLSRANSERGCGFLPFT